MSKSKDSKKCYSRCIAPSVKCFLKTKLRWEIWSLRRLTSICRTCRWRSLLKYSNRKRSKLSKSYKRCKGSLSNFRSNTKWWARKCSSKTRLYKRAKYNCNKRSTKYRWSNIRKLQVMLFKTLKKSKARWIWKHNWWQVHMESNL